MKNFFKILIGLYVIVAMSCTKGDVYSTVHNYNVSIPADITAPTKAVIAESAITVADATTATWEVYASNGTTFAKINGANYGTTNYATQPWIDDPVYMLVLGTAPTASTTSTYYEGKVGGNYAVKDGTIVATAETVDKNYLKPMKQAFYGGYDAGVTAVATNSTIVDASSAVEGGTENITYTLAWTDATKKAQYATAGFDATFTVADKITVKTGKNRTQSVSATEYPFTIQYIYVGSSKSVTYGAGYEYTPGSAGVFKLGLPTGGVFADDTKKVKIGGVTDNPWKSYTTNTRTYMNLLPNKADEVEVTLACWNCGKTIYTKSGSAITPGSVFYIQGTLKKGTTLSNPTNPDCEAVCETSGIQGVFMPDVLTSVTINITTLANCETEVTPTAGYVTSFEADVKYGSLDGTYVEK